LRSFNILISEKIAAISKEVIRKLNIALPEKKPAVTAYSFTSPAPIAPIMKSGYRINNTNKHTIKYTPAPAAPLSR